MDPRSKKRERGENVIKCKNEKGGKCNIGMRNACYLCDFLVPEAEEMEKEIKIKYFNDVQEIRRCNGIAGGLRGISSAKI